MRQTDAVAAQVAAQLAGGQVLLTPLPQRTRSSLMTTRIYWFRNDLRLHDNPALREAADTAHRLLPVYCHEPTLEQTTRWGFPRQGGHRRRFVADALAALERSLRKRGSRLLQIRGDPARCMPELAQALGAEEIHCERIHAPDEIAQCAALRRAGAKLRETWQSTLLDPAELPYSPAELPNVFTAFRRSVERAGLAPPAPLDAPTRFPPAPRLPAGWQPAITPGDDHRRDDPRSSFPYRSPEFLGAEAAALAHLDHYLGRKLPHSYKQTRNRLHGIDFSSKLSPWLACGAISARTVHARLKAFEAEYGASDGSYWLWFELLWRDYFRLLHLKHGVRLFHYRGLGEATPPVHQPDAFERWRQAATGDPLIDAGMSELAATGYLSNRMRQIVASYVVHDLGCDWRAGAAWFESQLLDYDVYSNHGNWLYIAGRGTDPRGGRRFNPRRQAREYDPDGSYRASWSHA